MVMNSVFFETDVWPAGDYEVRIDDGTSLIVCTQTLPAAEVGDAAPDTGPSESPDCQDASGRSTNFELNAAGDGIESLSLLNWWPEDVTISVFRDGEPVASEHFVPEYEEQITNAGCGAVYIGDVTMAW